MSIQYIARRPDFAPNATAKAGACPIICDSDDNKIKIIPAGSGTTPIEMIDASSTQTLTGKTLTAPTISGAVFTAPAATTSGIVIAKTIVFTEDATTTTHTGSVVLPAGSTLLDIMITNKALWTATGAVAMTVGDTASANGYFLSTNLKATDLVLGEVMSVSGSTGNWGGLNGAYLVAATGRRGPTSTNFGFYYDAGSSIVVTITVASPATTVGRTYATVLYAVGTTVAPVLT